VAASGLRGERERGRKPAVEAAQVRRERHTPPLLLLLLPSAQNGSTHNYYLSYSCRTASRNTPFVNLLPIIAIAAIAIASEGGTRGREAGGDGEKRNWLAGSRRKHPTHFRARLSGKVTGCLFLGQSFQ
jgi:hypothetical protein